MTVFEELGKLEPNKNVIPENYFSFSEAASYVIEYTDSEYNRLFEAVGIEELAVYESTGVQVVYEAGKLTELKDKVIKFIKKVWQAIKDFFTKVIGYFMLKTKAADKLKGVNKADVEKYVADDKKFGVISDWNKNKEFIVAVVDKLGALAENALDDIGDLAEDQFNNDGSFKDGKDASSLASAANEIVKNSEKNNYKAILGNDADVSDIAAFKKAFKAKFVTDKSIEVDKKYLVENIDSLVKVVADKEFLNKAKNFYNGIKKVVDECIKSINETYKDTKMAAVAQYATKAVGDVMKTAQAVSGIFGDLLRKKYAESLVIVVRAASAIAAGKKKAEKEAPKAEEKKEEAPAAEEKKDVKESVSMIDAIEEAFNW